MQHLRSRLAGGYGDDVSDGQLLSQFAATRDEAAFASLLTRHGPMVLATCRRILGNAADADDAFQAAFLVLARRADSLSQERTASAWLYGVAVRVAQKARVREARRRAREREAIRVSTSTPTSDADWWDVRPVIDEELDRLAAHYRDPVVLCCLEGRSREEAAHLLGWPEGTVSGRLARAKELLRERLLRRGVTCSVATLTAALTIRPGAASVPPDLAHAALVMALTGMPTAGVAELVGRMSVGGPAGRLGAIAFLTGAAIMGGVFALAPREQRTPEHSAVATTTTSSVRVVHGSEVLSVSTSVIGPFATSGTDSDVRVWKANGTLAAKCLSPGGAAAIAFSADGRLLAGAGFDGVVRVWDSGSGDLRYTLPGHGESANAVTFNPKGDVLATAGTDGRVRMWEAATGRHIRDLDAHRGRVWGLSFSPDGRELVSAGGDQTVRIWETATGTARRKIAGLRGGAYAVEFHPDGRTLAIAADNTVLLLNAHTGREVGRVGTPRVAVTWFAFSPDGRSLAYRDGSTVRLWEVASASDRLTIHMPTETAALAFSRDGRSLVTASGNTASVWEIPKIVRLLPATEMKALWTHLGGADAGVAFRAIETLAADPQRSIPLIRERLHAVPNLSARIEMLIAQLDDDAFEVREQASRELGEIGPDAAPALRKAIQEHPSAEVRSRAGRTVQRIGDDLTITHIRAIESLEWAGTSAARDVIAALAARELDTPLKREAAAALARLRSAKP